MGVNIPRIAIAADMNTRRCDHISADTAHIEAGPELAGAVANLRANRGAEVVMLAAAAGEYAPGCRQLAMAFF